MAACTRKTPTPAPTPVRTLSPTFTSTPLTKSLWRLPSRRRAHRSLPRPSGHPEPTATTCHPAAHSNSHGHSVPARPAEQTGGVHRLQPSADLRATGHGQCGAGEDLEVDPNFVTEIKRCRRTRCWWRDRSAAVARPRQLEPGGGCTPVRRTGAAYRHRAAAPGRDRCLGELHEPTPQTVDQMARLAVFEAERTRLLAAAGIRSCVGNFATGQPPFELWPAFYPRFRLSRRTTVS